MINHIPDLPNIPDNLKANFIGRGIVPFIGAGLSRIQGCPDWNGFADAVLDQLGSHGIISHAQINQLSNLGPRVKLSIARQIEEKKETAIISYADIFERTPNLVNLQINQALDQISKIIVTTNYDNLLEHFPPDDFDINTSNDFDQNKILSRKKVHSLNDFLPSTLNASKEERSVFHIHGSFKDPASMIISTTDYLNRYSTNNKNNHGYIDFLTKLFKDKVVLFMGYGTDELEVLEYIFQKGIKEHSGPKKEISHYLLQGFFTHEKEKANFLDDYFKTLGIQLLPFSLDKEGWNCQPRVIKYLANEIAIAPDDKLAIRNEMKDLL